MSVKTVTRDGIMDKVQTIVADVLRISPASVLAASRLAEDLGADDIDRVSVALDVETAFGFEVSDDDLETIVSVGDLVALIDGKLGTSS